MITFRPAWPDELERAARVYPPPSGLKKCFVAVADTPVEHILGVAYWHSPSPPPTMAETPCEVFVPFDWHTNPFPKDAASEVSFLRSLQAYVAKEHRSTPLRTLHMVPPEDPKAALLLKAGFHPGSTNVVFEGEHSKAVHQHRRLSRSFAPSNVDAWDIRSPRLEDAESIRRIVCEQEALIGPEVLTQSLAKPDWHGRAFDLAWSTVVICRETEKMVGIHLVRRQDTQMTVPATVILAAENFPPGLGWQIIFARWLAICAEHKWTGRFQCRINPERNATMLKLSSLLDYREIGRLHSYISPPATVAEHATCGPEVSEV